MATKAQKLKNSPKEEDDKDMPIIEDDEEWVRSINEEHERLSAVARGSDEVRFGRKYIGMVVLPQYMNEAIARYIAPADKQRIRTDYLHMEDALRSTGHLTPHGKGKGRAAKKERSSIRASLEEAYNTEQEQQEKNADLPRTLPGEHIHVSVPGKRPAPESLVRAGAWLKPHTIEYGPGETFAYLAAFALGSYGVLINVFSELFKRLPEFTPESILDFGSGPGTALWAAQEVWCGSVSQYTGIDVSEDMISSAKHLLYEMPAPFIPAKTDFLRYLAPEQPNITADLVVSAFTLSELPSDSARKTIVETLWDYTKDTLVLIDRGTPHAAQIISKARDQLLALNAKDARKQPVDVKEGETAAGPKRSSVLHTIAPFTNDLADPTANTPAWMHFSQRSQRPEFTMLTKHSKSNLEDRRYSYVIMRRGPRPEKIALQEQTLDKPANAHVSSTNLGVNLSTEVDQKSTEQLSKEAYYWSRIILPPIKKKGHVVLDVCVHDGPIERWTFTKSYDKNIYRDARKTSWGDLFPHKPKYAEMRSYFKPAPDTPVKTKNEKQKLTRKQRRSMMSSSE
ncbi:37S ribosomal protein S22 [Coemansia sp. RSA 988]|nr:37S ribosomal protein S22 [Coemansia sp. RSA 988]